MLITDPLLFTGACLRPLRSVLRTSLLAISHADRIERAANHVVTHTGQVLHAAASNKDNRVLLKVVADAGDIGRHLDTVGQTDTRDFPQRRIRFLRRLRVDASTNTALLRRTLERGTGRLVLDLLAAFANKLINRRHLFSS